MGGAGVYGCDVGELGAGCVCGCVYGVGGGQRGRRGVRGVECRRVLGGVGGLKGVECVIGEVGRRVGVGGMYVIR